MRRDCSIQCFLGEVPRSTLCRLSCLLAVFSLLGCGCQSNADYSAALLPDKYRSARLANAKPVDLVSVAHRDISADVVYPGDVLDVSITTGREETMPTAWSLRITDDGTLDVPLVGRISVAGRRITAVEQVIRNACIDREIYRAPYVAVTMSRRKMIRVRVAGAVDEPGTYELPAAGADLLAALVAAGGLAEEAGTVVEIRHPQVSFANREGVQIAPISYIAHEDDPSKTNRMMRIDLADLDRAQSLDLHVEDGTVVVANPKPHQSVSVIGLVRRPDNYPLPHDAPMRVVDAIALAGGRRVSVADTVRVIRQSEDADKSIVVEVSFKRAKEDSRENLVLAPNDVVSVEETPATFVVETIRGFLRFGFTSAIPGI